MAKILALSGFMGSGKTAVGREVARALGWAFCDLDDEVERRSDRRIPDIFRGSGEAEFRRLELETLGSVVAGSRDKGESGLVLALGGGTVTIPEAVALLRRDTLLVLLDADPQEAWDRVRTSDRPLARSWESFRELAEARRETYLDTAETVIEVSGRGVDELTEEVISALYGHCETRV